MNHREAKLNVITDYLNKRFNQKSGEYNISDGPKLQIIRYDIDTAISIWACGAIVCIGDMIYFISEDDGNWYCNDDYFQSIFSIGWADSFIKAFSELNKYVKENGEAVRYSLGTDSNGDIIYGDICNYKLTEKNHIDNGKVY